MPVIATGGLGNIVTPLTSAIHQYDPWLTLAGIRGRVPAQFLKRQRSLRTPPFPTLAQLSQHLTVAAQCSFGGGLPAVEAGARASPCSVRWGALRAVFDKLDDCIPLFQRPNGGRKGGRPRLRPRSGSGVFEQATGVPQAIASRTEKSEPFVQTGEDEQCGGAVERWQITLVYGAEKADGVAEMVMRGALSGLRVAGRPRRRR